MRLLFFSPLRNAAICIFFHKYRWPISTLFVRHVLGPHLYAMVELHIQILIISLMKVDFLNQTLFVKMGKNYGSRTSRSPSRSPRPWSVTPPTHARGLAPPPGPSLPLEHSVPPAATLKRNSNVARIFNLLYQPFPHHLPKGNTDTATRATDLLCRTDDG